MPAPALLSRCLCAVALLGTIPAPNGVTSITLLAAGGRRAPQQIHPAIERTGNLPSIAGYADLKTHTLERSLLNAPNKDSCSV
jgi:hypothetical protein